MRPLAQDEASRLAETMFLNHREGTANFEVSTLEEPGGRRLGMSGTVDWTARSGAANVLVEGRAGNLVAVAWGSNTVAEKRPINDGLLEGLGMPPGSWISRPIDTRRRVDQVIGMVMGLASKRPENAVLIQQKPGSMFLRNDTLRGSPVEVVRYGERSIFWIDKGTGMMLRFEGNNEPGTLPVIVDLRLDSVQFVRAPSAGEVISVGDKPELSVLLEGL